MYALQRLRAWPLSGSHRVGLRQSAVGSTDRSGLRRLFRESGVPVEVGGGDYGDGRVTDNLKDY